MENIENVINKVDETSLAHSFYDACSDKDFKDYIDGLNVEESILMKYTSSLQDAFLECKNCKKCKGLDTCKNENVGYVYTPNKMKNTISFSYDACEYEKERIKRDAYKDNIDLFEMPLDIQNATFKDLYKGSRSRIPILNYCKEFMTNYLKGERVKGIYLTGSFGSGKTYLIAALFNELAKKNVKSVSVYFPDFLTSLKSSFNTNFGERINYIKKVPLLLLDDIGAENCSNWSRDDILGPILQYRMDNHLPTFFTSNLTLEELESALSITSSGVDKVKARRIIERIKQLTETLELISESRRD